MPGSSGYLRARVGEEVRPVHVVMAERVLGRRLVNEEQVHHVDGDGHNSEPWNLVICQDTAYHRLLHLRTRIIRAGGNPNTDAVCGICSKAKPRSEFRKASSRELGVAAFCRSCHRDHERNYRIQKKAHR